MMRACTRPNQIEWPARPLALIPVNTIQAFLQAEYMNHKNNKSNGLRNSGISDIMRMMSEAWAFRGCQTRLVVPTWRHTASDLACMGFFGTMIEGRGGRGENLCFRFGGTKYLKVRNTESILGESRNTLGIDVKRST